jgi:hypothetical protein
MFQRDYLLRLIEQIMAFIARAIGLAREGRQAEAEREIERGYASLGLSRSMVDRLDATTLRALAGDRLTALVRLLEADVELAQIGGDREAAERRLRLASLLR